MGRTAELAQVQSWLSDAKIRSIGITGAGGYGKSMLLAKVCGEIEVASSSGFLGKPFEQIVWTTFTESYRFESWGGWLLVQLLGEIPIGLTRSELIPALVNVLAQRRCLLVLDNAETLLTESGDWLEAEYGKFWLAVMGATSQSVLVLASQEQPNLPPNLLNCSRWKRLGGLDEAAGVALLQAWEVSGSDAKLREFVRLCDGHPLLMDVVVGNLKADFELACIDDLPHANYELFNLIGLHRGDPMASLRAILAWSIARLPEELQGLILRLWIYPIPFNLVRLKDAYPDLQVTVGQCRQLARRSLLQERCQQRVWEFWFQPLIREYLQTRVLEDCRAKGSVWEEANTLQAIGDVLQFLDRRDEALERYDKALKLYEQVGDNLGKANTLQAIGDVLQFLKRCDEALERYDTALKLYEQVGSNLGKANTLQAIGDVLQFLKRCDEALERYDTALKLYEQVGSNLGKANTLQAIGDVLQFLKRCDEALERYDTALKLYEQVGSNLGKANTLKAI
ncbi:tetratricopeptide repeat protein, partial [Microcoleus sp. D2B6]|uniref:tetratricopeptide repeat protein n=2 Tax=Microcoleus TaxID=44471 RepID=UPI002FD0026B